LPALGLVEARAFALTDVVALKQADPRPVHLVFPVKDASEAINLSKLLAILDPLARSVIDAGWLALGEEEPGALADLTQIYSWVRLFPARRFLPPDQPLSAWGKGAVMRALLYHLIRNEGVCHSRTIVQFVDADILPSFFAPEWVLGAVGALLWFDQLEAAKLVYFRPEGGRLNTFLRSLLALIPHTGIQRLQKLVYLLSGELAGTLKFWTTMPFKAGYGVEILILLALALERAQISPAGGDLNRLAQVFVGDMDHRHAPLKSTRTQRGLDHMAGNVFHTIFEALEQAGVLSWSPGGPSPRRLLIPTPGAEPDGGLDWLDLPVGELTLAPLRCLPEIAGALK